MIAQKSLYAVVDVETTGGKPADTKITEIAIYISDGKNILEEYSTLVNPERPIDWYVVKLTGITNEMVSKAPKFEEVADRLESILSGKIFVAHNVDFDYNILCRQFLEIGRPFDAKKLCTVKSARKVFQGLSSYSLTNIAGHLQIELANAHRAAEDAKATCILLHKILEQADLEFLQLEIIQQNHIIDLPAHWTISENKSIEPSEGIIYFHDEMDEILYVEGAANIQKKLFSLLDHYRKNEHFSVKLVENVKKITLDYVYNSFKAELKSLNDIQRLKPRFNKYMKAQSTQFVIYMKSDEHELTYLNIVKKTNLKEDAKGPYIYSNSYKNAEKTKNKIIYSQDLSLLPVLKKQILNAPIEVKSIMTEEYNKKIARKIFKEYSCPLENGYYIFSINNDNEVEAIRVKDYFLHSWGQGIFENNAIANYQSEFDFDENQKITRKFLNILPKTSYKIVEEVSTFSSEPMIDS